MEDVFPAFKMMEEGHSILLAQAVSQITLILINQYAEVVAYPSATQSPSVWNVGKPLPTAALCRKPKEEELSKRERGRDSV